MNSVVRNKRIDGNSFQFQLTGTNVSIANAIRRTLLADIPTLVLDSNTCVVYKNTTRLNSELLKQRLGQIPVFISDVEEQRMAVDQYELVIQTKNETPEVVMITTNDFQIRKKPDSTPLPPEQLAAIFPLNPITHMPIDFGRMRGKIAGFIPAEELDLTCLFKIDTASTDGGYSVVSKATYQCTIDEQAAALAEQQYIAKQREENRENMTDIELEEYIQYKTTDFKLLDRNRYYKKDSFDFHVVSIGVYSPVVLVRMACDILIRKMQEILDLIQTNQLKIDVFPDYFYEITIPNDTFTLSKLIEFGLLHLYFQPETAPSILSFCAVKRSHPHSPCSVLRMATTTSSTSDDVVNMTKEVLELLMENYKKISAGLKR